MAKSRISHQTYSIKDLEHFTGIKAHTIRIWELRYNLFTPDRTPTNIRTYSGEDLKKLLSIASLVNIGHRISKLACLSADELNDLVNKNYVLDDFSTVIDGLIGDMIRFDQAAFEKRMSESIISLGFEEAVYRVVFPLFGKIGVLWQTDAINPAQEHFVSNIVRQKFISAIDSQVTTSPNAKKFLLFLPEQELHEMGLLLALFLIRKNGHIGIYLGQNVPTDDVVKTWEVVNPDYLFTHLTSHIDYEELNDYLKGLALKTRGAPILVSGQSAPNFKDVSIRNVKFLESPSEFVRKFLAHGASKKEK
jgi:MerR family transcriptional regulator, light-induced transcriptional regulator